MARTTRVYTRTRNGVTRFYLDLRGIGGTQEALVAPGDRSATTDRDISRSSWPASASRRSVRRSSRVRTSAKSRRGVR